MFSPNFSILSDPQWEIWPLLSASKNLGFVLYGGTALSLRLSHRVSVDFDFFSNRPLAANDVNLFESIPIIKESQIIQEEENTLSIVTPNGVKISFFGNIKFGCIQSPDITDDNNLYVASIIDIMATKLKTLLQRVSVKDYIDIAEILNYGISLESGIGAAMAIYKNFFPPVDAIRALTYFDSKELKSLSDNYKEILIDATANIDINNIDILPIFSEKIGVF